jgi:hypothetical protein
MARGVTSKFIAWQGKKTAARSAPSKGEII